MRIRLFTVTLLASTIATAATPVDGWYTNVFGGYTYLPANVSTAVSGVFFNGSGYNSGYNVGGRVGYQGNPMRYEFEYTYLNADANNLNVNYVSQMEVTGYTSANLAMANVYYDFREILPSISPFLGAGIGYAFVQTRLNSLGPQPITYSTSGNAFAYQGTVGLSYNFAENYAVNTAYRYVATNTIDNFGKTVQAHMANIGATYHFDRGNYK